MTRPSPTAPPLHVLVSPGVAGDPRFLETGKEMLARCGPGLALHLRLPGMSGRPLFELACRLAEWAREHGGWCVVNERPDIAVGAAAQAVQLGHTAIPVGTARSWIAGRVRIGVSVHEVGEAVRAAEHGANYLVLGTIYPTPSHPEHGGAGPNLVRDCRAALDLAFRAVDVVAVGGIDRTTVGEVLAAGAQGIAVQRAVWDEADPPAAARGLVELIAREGRCPE